MKLIHAKILDPTHLELARPLAACYGSDVLVVVTESPNAEAERRLWFDISSQALGVVYSDPEPEYTPSMIREANLGYES